MAALAGWISLTLFFAIAIVKPALVSANAAVFIGASVSLLAGVFIFTYAECLLQDQEDRLK